MSNLRILLYSLFLLGIWTVAFAHGSEQHVLGTIMVIDATHVDVKTLKGQTVSAHLTEATHYRVKGKAGSPSVPQVGDRVVIDVTRTGDVLTATEIQFAKLENKVRPNSN